MQQLSIRGVAQRQANTDLHFADEGLSQDREQMPELREICGSGNMSKLFDVVAVNMKTHRVTLMGEGKTFRNAEVIENMAVMRRGVDEEFFVTVEAGKYQDGDEWDTDDDGAYSRF